MSNKQLPNGWEIKKLGEVVDIINGKNQSQVISVAGKYPIYGSGGNIMGFATDYICEKGTTIIGRKGNISNPIFINERFWNVDTAFGIYPKNESNPKFINYLCQTIDFKSRNKGTTIPSLVKSDLLTIEINFPKSLPEQQRIVSILDEAFAAIDKAKANAERNLKNAKELFESYMQGVFENGDWEKKELRELTTILGDGLHGTPEYSTNGEYYFINGNNLNDGKIEFKDSTKRVNVDEFKKYKKNLNDRTILVSINGTLGNVAFYNSEKIILGKSACYFNLKESVDKDFVKYVLSSPYFIKYAHREATGATIKNVSLKSMREFKVPYPTLDVQQTIVQKLDTLQTETQKLEAIYKKKIADLEELKKSVLQKAFRGGCEI